MIVGIGIDLAEVARYDFSPDMLEGFARKVYTAEEMSYAMRTRNWQQRLAGFFAAKEAARKAFGLAIPWHEVGVTHAPSGAPSLLFLESTADLPRSRGVTTAHLTITHTETTAAAFVILER